jgi:hypothetical protein
VNEAKRARTHGRGRKAILEPLACRTRRGPCVCDTRKVDDTTQYYPSHFPWISLLSPSACFTSLVTATKQREAAGIAPWTGTLRC